MFKDPLNPYVGGYPTTYCLRETNEAIFYQLYQIIINQKEKKREEIKMKILKKK